MSLAPQPASAAPDRRQRAFPGVRLRVPPRPPFRRRSDRRVELSPFMAGLVLLALKRGGSRLAAALLETRIREAAA